MTQRKLIFFHLPKTAGTSLRDELCSHFKEEDIQLIYGRKHFREGVRNFARNDKRFAMGHFGWEPEFRELLSDMIKISFLREPVARVISHYLQFKRSHYPEHQRYRQMNFEQFLHTPFASNWQCRRLGGGFYNEAISDEECFEEAALNVQSRFEMIGLVELMEESLRWLEQLSGLKLGALPHLNPKHKVSEDNFRVYDEVLRGQNQYDLELYRLAHERLEKLSLQG